MGKADSTGGSTMEAMQMLKSRLARLRAGRIDIRNDEVLQRLLARIRASHTLDDLIIGGFPGLGELPLERAVHYWEGKALRAGRNLLREDDIVTSDLVLVQGVLSPPNNEMPWEDNSGQKLLGQGFRVLALQLPFALLEPASRSLSNGEPISLDLRRLALIRCSSEFFHAQRGTPPPANPPEAPSSPSDLPF